MRDLKRATQTFFALEPMVRNEVNWVDILAYSVLLSKNPGVCEEIARRPDDFVIDPYSTAAQMALFDKKSDFAESRLEALKISDQPAIEALVGFLFPNFSKHDLRWPDQELTDSLRYSRPLRTMLLLGLQEGSVSKGEIERLLRAPADQVSRELEIFRQRGLMPEFASRLLESYPFFASGGDFSFWEGVAEFARRREGGWLASYVDIPRLLRDFDFAFMRAAAKNKDFFDMAPIALQRLSEKGDRALLPIVLRHEIHAHGLYGWVKRDGFLAPEELVRSLVEVSAKRDVEDLKYGNFLQSLWTPHSIFNAKDAGMWDAECVDRTNVLLDSDEAVVGLTILFFGGDTTTEFKTLNYLLDAERLRKRAGEILSKSGDEVSPAAKGALSKIVKGDWFE